LNSSTNSPLLPTLTFDARPIEQRQKTLTAIRVNYSVALEHGRVSGGGLLIDAAFFSRREIAVAKSVNNAPRRPPTAPALPGLLKET